MKRTTSRIILILFFAVLMQNFTVSVKGDSTYQILLVSQNITPTVTERFQLDPLFDITIRESVGSSLDNYDSIILFDYNPTTEEQAQIESFQGGIAFFIGQSIIQNASLLINLNLATENTGDIIQNLALPEPVDKDSSHPLVDNIQWNSVVRIRNYTDLTLSGDVLLQTSSDSDYPNIPLLSMTNNGKYVAVNFVPSEEDNSELIQWPYFNYFLYLIMMNINQEEPLSYADWRYSPVPHTPSTIFLGVTVLVTTAITLASFILVRKYSKKTSIEAKDLEEISKEIKEEKDWEDVGMHRQLAGFFVQLFIGLLIILPNVVMTSLVFPLLILPSPQAAGFYDFTIRFFEALWLFFDIGTSVVLVKFFSQHRVKNPRQAIKYIQ
ncbi:MAG: hypothetical protein ACTSPI_05420, partial [Candidatus Heimdallarchaeaceae archaeon]